jgi:hypothetical protein
VAVGVVEIHIITTKMRKHTKIDSKLSF